MRQPLCKALAAAFVTLAIAQPTSAEVAAPTLKAGDSWSYRQINAYNKADAGIVSRDVKAAGAREIRMVTRSSDGRVLDEASYSGPGMLAAGMLSDRASGTLSPALELAPYPLREGAKWTQRVTRDDVVSREKRATLIIGKVLGWEAVKVPAGEFRALRIERRIELGDHDPFRGPTLRWETEWYSPEVKAAVKLEVFEEYYEHRYNRAFAPLLPGERSIYELVSYKSG